MILEKMIEPIEPGNPFLSDLENMGTQIGTNVIVMHRKHTSEKQDWIIIVNTVTGERMKLAFKEEAYE